jgi:hypothetical protein
MDLETQASGRPVNDLESKEEWQVRIYADLKRVRDSIPDDSPGSKVPEYVQREMERKVEELRERSFGWILKQAERAELNQIPLGASSHEKKEMILDSVYLVRTANREAFLTVVRCLEKKYGSDGLHFECIGPREPSELVSPGESAASIS